MPTLEVSISIITIHLIRKLLLTILEQDKGLIEVSIKYGDFADVFSSDLVIELSDCTKINKYAIKPVEGKPSLYNLI